MNDNRIRTAWIFLAILLIATCLISYTVLPHKSVGAKGNLTELTLVNIGDCRANDTVGDIYPDYDPFCRVKVNNGALSSSNNDSKAHESDLVPVSVTTENPPATSVTPPTQAPTEIAFEQPTQIATEAPTQAPAPVVTESTTEAPTEESDEKECKNKNSGKDGTPDECNAGKGQEKK